MRAKQFAVCDSDRGYLCMVQAYLQKKNPTDFEILVFDTVSKALLASQEAPFEILLVGEDIYDTNVTNICASKIYILQEDGLKGITGYSVVVKYQSMEKLLAQVLDEFALDDSCKSAVTGCSKNQTTLVSFYSPDRHRGQTMAAFGAAQVLADEGERVLYLNLMPFAGFEELFQTSYDADVTDFMYFVLNHADKLLYKLEGLKRSSHGVDYLPPALDYTDLLQIDRSSWESVMTLLLHSSDYTYVVADLSETCQGFYDLLRRSDAVYLPTDQKGICSQAMMAHFRRLMQAKEYTEITQRMIEFELPINWEQAEKNWDNMALSAVYRCVKGVLGRK